MLHYHLKITCVWFLLIFHDLKSTASKYGVLCTMYKRKCIPIWNNIRMSNWIFFLLRLYCQDITESQFLFLFSFTETATANWGAQWEAERRDDEYDNFFSYKNILWLFCFILRLWKDISFHIKMSSIATSETFRH